MFKCKVVYKLIFSIFSSFPHCWLPIKQPPHCRHGESEWGVSAKCQLSLCHHCHHCHHYDHHYGASPKSHIWDFVRQYGIMFVMIVIIIIIIIIYRKVKVSTLQYVEMCVHWGEPSGSASTCKVSPSSGLPLLNGKRILQFHRLA